LLPVLSEALLDKAMTLFDLEAIVKQFSDITDLLAERGLGFR